MMKPVKKHRSWKACPACSSRATKIFSMNTGKYQCQVCRHEYEDPTGRPVEQKMYKFKTLLGNRQQYVEMVGDSLSQIDKQVLKLIPHYNTDSKRPIRTRYVPRGYPKGTRVVTVTGYNQVQVTPSGGRRVEAILIFLIPF